MVMTRGGSDFVGYEYKEKIVKASQEALYLDSYPCFGWEEAPNNNIMSDTAYYTGHVALRFRRDRKICNKAELTRLQRNFDGCVKEIEKLEKSKNSMPGIWALVCGLIGTALIAVATFAILGMILNIPTGVIFAIPGFACWIASYFVYKKLVTKQAEKMLPVIEDKYDELYEICEKANKLLV